MLARSTLLVRSFASKTASPTSATFSLAEKFSVYKPKEDSLFGEGLPTETTASRDDLLRVLRMMLVIRRVEQTCDAEYKQRNIRGFCHLYLGQEAVCTGIEEAITRDSAIITAYRDHGYQIVRGDRPAAVFAEMFGRSNGCAKGKGGSMHMYKSDAHFYGGNGIVGAQIPVGAGLAFAQKYRGDGQVTFALYGDGAANQGQVFEAYNMASLWNLPIIFCCENNRYGMGTSEGRAAAETRFYRRGQYIPGLKIDGMDILAVREGCRYAAEWAREKGPIVVEFDTYRYSGHSMSDPGLSYRTRDEVQEIRAKRDPIEGLKLKLQESGLASEEEIKEMEKEVKSFVADELKVAKDGSHPDMSELYTEVYLNNEVALRGTEYGTGYTPRI